MGVCFVQYELSAHGKSRILANAVPGGTSSHSSTLHSSVAHASSSAKSAAAGGAGSLATVPAAMYSGRASTSAVKHDSHVHLEHGHGQAEHVPVLTQNPLSKPMHGMDASADMSFAEESNFSVAQSSDFGSTSGVKYLGVLFRLLSL